MHKELLIKLLGLEASATDEVISNAATTFQTDMVAFKTELEGTNEKLSNAARTAEERAVAAENEAKAAKIENKALTEELVGRDLEVYADRITNAADVKAALLTNRAGTIAVLKNVKVAPVTVATAKAAKEPLHNSRIASNPAPIEQATSGKDFSKEDIKKISNRAREMQGLIKGLPWTQAFVAAKAEVAAPAAK